MTSGSFSTTAYSKAFKSDEFVIAASIYQNELVCIAFQTEKGEFRIDLFRFTAYEPLQTQTDLSNKPPLIKIGSSIFIDLYPTFLSFVDPADKMVSLVIGHGPTDANGDLSGLSRNSNSNNDISTLRVYQFDSSLGIIQDGRCEFLLSNSHGKVYLPLPYDNSRVLITFVRKKSWPNGLMCKRSYALSVREWPRFSLTNGSIWSTASWPWQWSSVHGILCYISR